MSSDAIGTDTLHALMSLVATGQSGGPRRLRRVEYRAQYSRRLPVHVQPCTQRLEGVFPSPR